jgi:hypothetical protein
VQLGDELLLLHITGHVQLRVELLLLIRRPITGHVQLWDELLLLIRRPITVHVQLGDELLLLHFSRYLNMPMEADPKYVHNELTLCQ